MTATTPALDEARIERFAQQTMGRYVDGMLTHSADYLELFSTFVVSWQWLLQTAAASEGLAEGRGSRSHYQGKLAATRYWLKTELPKNTAAVIELTKEIRLLRKALE